MSQLKSPEKSSSFEYLFAISIFLLAQGFTLYRLFFGVNFFDEPFYFSLPYRFLFKQRLFIDDLVLAQTFSLLIYPFVKLHLIVFKSTELLLLSMRLWFWALYLLLATVLIVKLRKMFSLPVLLTDRKSTRLNSSHTDISRMPSSA